eukprot:835443-Amphidinium_carterae.1
MLYGLALVRFRENKLLNAMSKRIPRVLQNFNTQQVANVTFALCRLQQAHPECLHALSMHAAKHLHLFKTLEVTMFIYSCAALRYYCHRFWLVAPCQVLERFPELSAQGISNVIYSCGVLAIYKEELLAPVCREAERRAIDFNEQGIANITYAMGLLQRRDVALFEALFRVVSTQVNTLELTTQNISNMVYSYALVSWRSEKVLMQLCTLFTSQLTLPLKGAEPQHVAVMAFSLGHLNFPYPGCCAKKEIMGLAFVNTWSSSVLGICGT